MPRLISRALAIGLLALLAACDRANDDDENTSKTFSTVVVDAGHGRKDNGAYRRYGPPEKVVTLDVAQRLNRKLRESEIKTVMTRSSDVLFRWISVIKKFQKMPWHSFQRFPPARLAPSNLLSFWRFIRAGGPFNPS